MAIESIIVLYPSHRFLCKSDSLDVLISDRSTYPLVLGSDVARLSGDRPIPMIRLHDAESQRLSMIESHNVVHSWRISSRCLFSHSLHTLQIWLQSISFVRIIRAFSGLPNFSKTSSDCTSEGHRTPLNKFCKECATLRNENLFIINEHGVIMQGRIGQRSRLYKLSAHQT